MSRKNKAFTLIELLVVMSIISLLISILLPALAKTREAAQRTRCLTGLRQNLMGMHAYAADSKNLLPSSSPTATSHNRSIDSPGGYGSVSGAAGLGVLLYSGYVTTIRAGFCPSENGAVASHISYNRAVALGYLNVSTFQSAIDNGTMGVKFSYAVRTMRWARNGDSPALLFGKTLQVGDPYIYAIDQGPLVRYPAAAIISDTFAKESGKVSPIRSFHVDGLNVGYADGHGKWVGDNNARHLRDLEVYRPEVTDQMRFYGEDIWDALDGDIGYQHPAYNAIHSLN